MAPCPGEIHGGLRSVLFDPCNTACMRAPATRSPLFLPGGTLPPWPALLETGGMHLELRVTSPGFRKPTIHPPGLKFSLAAPVGQQYPSCSPCPFIISSIPCLFLVGRGCT
eukprot:gene16378-biopygen21787